MEGVRDDAGHHEGQGPNDGHAHENPRSPQLRTLLLLDICDSTQLVEVLGDTAAAQLFREHDRLVLRLQQQWRGRLIDRSDGLLLLFERPIDGLGFALDYLLGLRDIGRLRELDLKARAGLHVGEVLTWRNSDEAVRLGAKPLEVEGLAKPMAARLMSIARPGQILLSAVAEPLVHRAVRDIGERGQSLVWKSHGRWRFKGVTERQEIFEVGEPGLVPLKRPIESPKARRDVPSWRRPAALAAEAALVAAIAVGGWFATRPPPAIAFNERDWVVVGDMRNLTGDARLDDSLEQAFRISLEQSRFVNVLSDLKVRDSLGRMELDPGTVVDRNVGAEIALREGVRAVVLPTVSEVGGKLRVSVEVVDPATGSTVHALQAQGQGSDSALASIDRVVASLRTDLGEALAAVDGTAAPLPQVTTSNIDALRAYALGQTAFAEDRADEAIRLYGQAIELDPDFALAHQALARVHTALSDRQRALVHLQRALELKAHLPPRDRLYLDAWHAELLLPGEALSRWKVLASMYPDSLPGQANVAGHQFKRNEYAASLAALEDINLPQQPMQGVVADMMGRALLAQGRLDEAKLRFDAAEAVTPGISLRRRAWWLAAQDKPGEARALIEAMPSRGFVTEDLVRYIDLATLAADEGQWDTAGVAYARAREALDGSDSPLARQFELEVAALDALRNGDGGAAPSRLEALARRQLEAFGQPDNANRVDDAFMALVAAYLAQRGGDATVGRQVLAALHDDLPALEGTQVEDMAAVVESGQARLSGDAGRAIALLQPQVRGAGLVQAHVAMWEALNAAGRHDEALERARWLQAQRPRAYAEANASQVLQLMNVVDTRLAHLQAARSLQAGGDAEGARAEVDRLLDAWPRSRWPDYLLRSTESILPASKANTTM